MSRWLKAICQFDPPAENTVAKLTNSQFSLFLDSCENISDWGNLWVQLSFEVVSCTFTFAFTPTMQGFFELFFACLLLLPSPEAHIKWLLHVVSQEAAKFASKMYVHLLEICMHLGCSFDLIPKRRGPNIV